MARQPGKSYFLQHGGLWASCVPTDAAGPAGGAGGVTIWLTGLRLRSALQPAGRTGPDFDETDLDPAGQGLLGAASQRAGARGAAARAKTATETLMIIMPRISCPPLAIVMARSGGDRLLQPASNARVGCVKHSGGSQPSRFHHVVQRLLHPKWALQVDLLKGSRHEQPVGPKRFQNANLMKSLMNFRCTKTHHHR